MDYLGNPNLGLTLGSHPESFDSGACCTAGQWTLLTRRPAFVKELSLNPTGIQNMIYRTFFS